MTEAPTSTPLSEADELLLGAYLDDELPKQERAAFKARLDAEPGLRAAFDQLAALLLAIDDKVEKPAASGAFRERIARIGVDAATVSPVPVVTARRTYDWRMMAATAVIACAVGSAVTQVMIGRLPGAVASQALVAVHQRALLATEPVEVASSDRHTIKPWFDAKLAVSPPVVDLAGDGFPLAGGRIDVVGGRRVPVLIYRRRAHLVSVIAVPEAGGRDEGAAPVRASRDGFTMLTWRGADFRFSAVADVADDDLVRFVVTLRRTMQAQ